MARRTQPWTTDERALIERERQRWLAIGRSTERANIPALQAAWAALYRRAGREPVFVWVTDGPLAAHAAMAVWSQHGLGGRDSLMASLEASLRDSLGASLRDSLRDSLGDLWSSLGDSLRASLGQKRITYQPTWWWGAHDAYLVGWYRTAQQLGVVFDAEQDARLSEIEQTVRHGLWAWPHERGVVVCDRPTVCRMEDPAGDGRWRLHADDGPVLAWRDGCQIHAWHGVRVPADVIEHPETLTAERITAEPNQEIRRAMIERIGWPVYLERAGARPVHSDHYGDLYRWPVDGVDLACVVVTNRTPEPDGHYKRYGLLVPQTCRTAHEAVAQTFGLTTEHYAPAVES